jgi:hypothetical protein
MISDGLPIPGLLNIPRNVPEGFLKDVAGNPEGSPNSSRKTTPSTPNLQSLLFGEKPETTGNHHSLHFINPGWAKAPFFHGTIPPT